MSAGAPSIPTLLISHWTIDAPLDLLAALAAGIYVLAATRVRRGWPVRRTAAFLGGVAAVLMALQSGVGAFDDRLLSAHMAQHMLLLLVAPLLLLAGQPALLVIRALAPGRRQALARALTRVGRAARPAPCLAAFAAVLLVTHLPGFYDAALSHPPLHELEHALYLLAGTLLWWPILDADPSPARRLGGLGRLAYLLIAMAPMALIGAYLNRHVSLVYPAYAAPGRALGISSVTDQQQAGAIMWVAGNTIMVAVGLWATMAALIAEERRQRAQDTHAAALTRGGVR